MKDDLFNGDGIPTYEESLLAGATPTSTSSGAVKGLSLTEQLADTRSYRIRSLIESYINPLLTSQAHAGLYKTTLVLIPEDTAGDDAVIVGFPDHEVVKLHRLRGEEYAPDFWRQEAVVAELEIQLKASLRASGHCMEEDVREREKRAVEQSPVSPPQSTKRSFFRRSSEKTAQGVVNPITPEATNAGWSTPKEKVLGLGQLRVKVGLQDVCLRVSTPMGLYETKTGSAIVVRMEIGG